MNELEFKRHLKALIQGHHHPEEHDWQDTSHGESKQSLVPSAKRRTARKTPRKK